MNRRHGVSAEGCREKLEGRVVKAVAQSVRAVKRL